MRADELKRRLESLSRQINGLLVMNRIAKDRIDALEDGQARLEQAMLEMAAALRRSGHGDTSSDGVRALSLPPSESHPDRQSADAETTLSP